MFRIFIFAKNIFLRIISNTSLKKVKPREQMIGHRFCSDTNMKVSSKLDLNILWLSIFLKCISIQIQGFHYLLRTVFNFTTKKKSLKMHFTWNRLFESEIICQSHSIRHTENHSTKMTLLKIVNDILYQVIMVISQLSLCSICPLPWIQQIFQYSSKAWLVNFRVRGQFFSTADILSGRMLSMATFLQTSY